MEGTDENLREALSNIARQARTLLDNLDDRNILPIERRLMNADNQVQTQNIPCQRGEEVSRQTPTRQTVLTVTPSPAQNVRITGGARQPGRKSTAVPAALRRSFPTLASTSGSSRSSKKPAKKAKKANVVYKDVVLLPTPGTKTVPTHQTRCQLEGNGFVIHGFPVDKSWEEEEFKAKIRELFLPLEDMDFDFVKSCYGQIVTPKLATGVKFSAARVIGLCGQGSIYIRPKDDFPVVPVSESSHSPVPVLSDNEELDDNDRPSTSSNAHSGQDLLEPCCSVSLRDEDQMDQLCEMFPEKSSDVLHQALASHGTVSRAALYLSSAQTYTLSDEDDDDIVLQASSVLLKEEIPVSLQSILKELQKGMSAEKEKLKIDEEDILSDAMSYYKDINFDAKKRLRVLYRGQPAVDTGGVTRQFFTQLLNVISEMFFHGSDYKSPVYNADIVASGMMKYFGTIIVHSILQGGPDFPVLSPAVYRYLATGDIDAAMEMVTFRDCSESMKHFIGKVL